MASVEKNIFFARLAEQAERFEDMIRHMTEVVKVRRTLCSQHQSIGWTLAVIRGAQLAFSRLQKRGCLAPISLESHQRLD